MRRPVFFLALSVFFLSLAWSALIPLWHTPDEQAHFAQAQDFAVFARRPAGKSTSRDIVESEELLGTFRTNGENKFTYHPEYNIPYTTYKVGHYEQKIENFPLEYRREFTINEASGYPPLYYQFIALVNKVFWQQGLITRVFLSRIATLLLGIVGVVVIYQLIKSIRHPELSEGLNPLIITALIMFLPMRVFSASGVTSDALFNFTYPLLFLITFKLIRKPTLKKLLLLIGAIWINWQIKPQAILFIPTLIPLAFIVLKNKFPSWLKIISSIFLLAGFTGFFTFLLEHLQIISIPHFGIPDVGSFAKFSRPISFFGYLKIMLPKFYQETLPWFFGIYRWLSLILPINIYRVIKIILGLSAIGLIKFFFQSRNLLLFLIWGIIIYVFGILTWDWLFFQTRGFSIGLQGRYFFPILPNLMILVYLGLKTLLPKITKLFLIPLVLIFNWYSLWHVSSSYYQNLTQASQYKPWFFKIPFLSIIIVIALCLTTYFALSLIYAKRKNH
jgi:hypothetical protein